MPLFLISSDRACCYRSKNIDLNLMQIKCNEVLLEDVDIPRAIADYVNTNAIENLVLGAASKGGLIPR